MLHRLNIGRQLPGAGSYKLQHRRLRLNLRTNFLTVRPAGRWNGRLGGLWKLLPGRFPKGGWSRLSGMGRTQQLLHLGRGLDWRPLRSLLTLWICESVASFYCVFLQHLALWKAGPGCSFRALAVQVLINDPDRSAPGVSQGPVCYL